MPRRIAVLGALAGLRLRAVRKLPARPDEMTGVAVRIAFQIILVLRLGVPEGTGGCELGYDFARPETGGLDIRDRILRDALLLVVHTENGGSVARSSVVALTVARGGIVNLEEKFQQRPVADQLRIESDLDRLRMRAVMVVGRVRDIA